MATGAPDQAKELTVNGPRSHESSGAIYTLTTDCAHLAVASTPYKSLRKCFIEKRSGEYFSQSWRGRSILSKFSTFLATKNVSNLIEVECTLQHANLPFCIPIKIIEHLNFILQRLPLALAWSSCSRPRAFDLL